MYLEYFNYQETFKNVSYIRLYIIVLYYIIKH
jgi:hypothetical protein